MTQTILIIGASARAAAFSARRAGFAPAAIDLFADRDLESACVSAPARVDRFASDAPLVEPQFPQGPFLYTGGLENDPELIGHLASRRVLWGNDAQSLERVRDPVRLAKLLQASGIPGPRVLQGVTPANGTWLVKPLRGSGGRGIRFGNPAEAVPPDHYLQEFVPGVPLAGIFLARPEGCELLGVTRQWIGRPWLQARPFQYCGSIGPLPLTPAKHHSWTTLGQVIAQQTGLRGLFGIDAVVQNGVPLLVEVNPRYTASIEVIELASGRTLLGRHASVFQSCAIHDRPARPGFLAKGIVFAPREFVFPESGPWDRDLRWSAPWDEPISFADIPHPRTPFQAGDPVLSLLAHGSTLRECARNFRQKVRELVRYLWNAETHPCSH